MKKYLFTFIALFILIGNATSQETYVFRHIRFLDYSPKWFYYVTDSISSEYDFYKSKDSINQFKYVKDIIKDSVQYCLYSTSLNAGLDGSYIEKRNIYTGEKIWSRMFDLRNVEINERPNNMEFNHKGELEIFGYRKFEREWRPNFSNAYSTSKFMFRKLNPDTGELLSFIYADKTDSLSPLLYSGGTFPPMAFYKLKENEFQYVLKYDLEKRYFRISYIFDSTGQILSTKKLDLDSLLSTEEILVDTLADFIDVRPLKLLNDSIFITTRLIYNRYSNTHEKHKYRFYIEKYDRNLNIINSVDISDVLKAKNRYKMYIEYVDEDVVIIKYRNEPEFRKWRYYYYIFNHDGTLLDSINTYPGKNDFNSGTIKRISDNEYLIIGTNLIAVDKNFKMYFYKKKIGEPIRMIRKTRLGPTVYFARIKRIEILENGDYLCYGSSGPKISNHGFNNWPFWMYIPAEDLEEGVAVEDVKGKEKQKFSIYPNPPSDKLNIEFPESFKGHIEIVDELGRIIAKHKITNEIIKTVDISKLQSGLYFVRAISDNKIYQAVSFVKE